MNKVAKRKINDALKLLQSVRRTIEYTPRNPSIMKVPILEVSCRVKKRTTICKITWYNPATACVRITKGIATCNLHDIWDITIGQRLSESRAKITMYNEYMQSLCNTYTDSMNKHSNLIQKEAEHQRRIKPSKENNM